MTPTRTFRKDPRDPPELTDPAGHARVLLDAQPSAIHEARRHLQYTLDLFGLSGARQHDALLLTSELVSNALEHGSRDGDPIELVWRFEHETLHLAVVDAARGASVPAPLTPSEERTQGRGLRIVGQLADWWDQRIVRGRREVAFRLKLTSPR